MKTASKYRRGFTLIEVLITIAIVGILAAIALPAYDRYVRQTNRTSAKSAVEKMRGLQEAYYSNNKGYSNNLTDLGYASNPATIDKTGEEVAAGSGSAKYQVSINTLSAGTMKYCANCDYEIVAVPQGTQTKDTDCAVMWFNSRGQKGSENTAGTATTNCW